MTTHRWADIRRAPAGIGSAIRGALGRLVFWICLRPVLWLLRPNKNVHPDNIRSFASLANYLKGKKAPGYVAFQVLSESSWLREKCHVDDVELLVVGWHGPGLRYGVRAVCLIRFLDGGFSCLYHGWPGPRRASVAAAAQGVKPEAARLLAWAWFRSRGGIERG